jgi:hypothetical protein
MPVTVPYGRAASKTRSSELQSIGPSDFPKPMCTRPWSPLLRLTIDGNNAELRPIATHPFKIIKGRPAEISTGFNANQRALEMFYTA